MMAYRRLTIILLTAILLVQMYIAWQVSEDPAPVIRPRPIPTSPRPDFRNLEPPYDSALLRVDAAYTEEQ